MKYKIIITIMVLLCLVSTIAGSTITNKEIDLEENKKSALSNIGITDLVVKHNCEIEKGGCKATLYKQTSRELEDEETGNYSTIYTTVLNKEIEIDTSEKFCIKEELDKEMNEMVCVKYRGLTTEEINEKIRIATEDKLKFIADVLIQRQGTESPQDNEMEISIK